MERESFLGWISNFDFEKVHDAIYAKKHKDTGDWLLRKEEFQTWFGSPESSLLWCHGKRVLPRASIMKYAYKN
jgi:hypothetical protein